MRCIGLIGGMSWESTVLYYQHINQGIKAALGGLHSAKLVLVSVDFAEIERLQHAGAWHEAGLILAQAAQSLQAAGAECVVVCTNTMHKLAQQIQDAVDIPLLHIGDATARAILNHDIRKVALLGTAFTMEQDFYRARLQAHGLEVLLPARPTAPMFTASFTKNCVWAKSAPSRAPVTLPSCCTWSNKARKRLSWAAPKS
jgi:aspartate racemase